MTDRKTNLPEEPIFEEAEDDGCPSIENSSHLSVPTVEENKDFSEYNGEEAEEVVVPEKPASAYATVSIMCLCMAFGGFMSGWDTGTISGFVNQTDF
ncbi:BAF_HP2_G0030850.mRNA.1.CDS.1 [Saccharomyces cerevisiae]|nr:BAF_HP2_G0030850.mRNA.1.CDS.1 [Saccharomyces cerevisiae]CAI6579405.1 BAF_HP1_G0027910.mRNA.1.CDS.1 [Saccharomyces cerevisiae]CAI6815289.1 BAF_HP2_G0030850.mRNA.1.CDS.1 [Saccharomyces cerevisiae]